GHAEARRALERREGASELGGEHADAEAGVLAGAVAHGEQRLQPGGNGDADQLARREVAPDEQRLSAVAPEDHGVAALAGAEVASADGQPVPHLGLHRADRGDRRRLGAGGSRRGAGPHRRQKGTEQHRQSEAETAGLRREVGADPECHHNLRIGSHLPFL
ncbi:MAG: hypothetical protein AVDCRST_MAG65-1292, partial [uncultured Solirubrobacteraceae bacterium]